ncbi:hypothetical protein [Thermodesulforhabdus norvegica]|uniref:Magnetosome protein MamS/MamX domain-containing protein n=1 Tax=Thermodesulforhabdus norvegica TaxID=39841 RepID=A0A1I4VQ84_9BACT|nr:hypothetical protein [Thermodesulforhabdus norvegica]SFN03418.1 hypothetical protein SAMN05660836_02397 [Thermodesulforhabdus norvegica]
MSGVRVLLLLVFIGLLGLYTGTAFSGKSRSPEEMGGWEPGSEYNKLYVPEDREKFKGTVLEVKEVVPMPGMSPGVALVVRDRDGEEVTVHVGPRWFIDPATMGIHRGDQVKVYGVWAEVDGQDVFIASKIKKGEHFELKVRRTRDGMPYWAMSPEELEKERSDQ